MLREGGAGPAPRPGPRSPGRGAERTELRGRARSGAEAEAERCDVQDVVQGEPGTSGREGRGGMRVWAPALRLSCRQPVQRSVVSVVWGLIYFILFYCFRKNEGGVGRKERKQQRPSRALGCPGSAAVAADGAGAFHS